MAFKVKKCFNKIIKNKKFNTGESNTYAELKKNDVHTFLHKAQNETGDLEKIIHY